MSINKTTSCEESTIKVLAWPKQKNCKNNPYNYILYTAMPDGVEVNEFHPRKMRVADEAIFHIHWPDMLLRSRRWWRIVWRFIRLQKAINKIQGHGGKVVWTVHNLKPHLMRFPSLCDLFMRRFISCVDGLIFLTENSRNDFLILYPEFEYICYRIIPHAHYRSYYPINASCVNPFQTETFNRVDLSDTNVPASTDREDHGVKDKALSVTKGESLILMFGKIRAHKGLNDLLTAKKKLNLSELHLLIAGNPGDNGVDKLTAEALKQDPHCHTFFKHIDNDEVSGYFDVSDAVILPYTDILNSGTAILALSFGVPIIAPAIGSLISLNKSFGDDWVFLYDRPLRAETLERAMIWVRKKRNSLPDLSELEPEKVSSQTLAFYRDLLNQD